MAGTQARRSGHRQRHRLRGLCGHLRRFSRHGHDHVLRGSAGNEEKQIQEFLSHFNIKNIEQKLYGDIFKEKIETDKNFKAEFENKIKNFIDKDML